MNTETQTPPAVVLSTAQLCDRITALEAQIASLVMDIKRADTLLSAGDDNGALVQVRWMHMRATKSYLDYVGRTAIRESHNAEVSGLSDGPPGYRARTN